MSSKNYKVGDKVRVKKDLIVDESYDDGMLFISDMVRFKGKVVTITKVNCIEENKTRNEYRINEDDGIWRYTDEMLELPSADSIYF